MYSIQKGQQLMIVSMISGCVKKINYRSLIQFIPANRFHRFAVQIQSVPQSHTLCRFHRFCVWSYCVFVIQYISQSYIIYKQYHLQANTFQTASGCPYSKIVFLHFFFFIIQILPTTIGRCDELITLFRLVRSAQPLDDTRNSHHEDLGSNPVR